MKRRFDYTYVEETHINHSDSSTCEDIIQPMDMSEAEVLCPTTSEDSVNLDEPLHIALSASTQALRNQLLGNLKVLQSENVPIDYQELAFKTKNCQTFGELEQLSESLHALGRQFDAEAQQEKEVNDNVVATDNPDVATSDNS